MTKGSSFKRAIRRQARASGQSYAQTRAQMETRRGDARRRPRAANERPIPELLAHVVLDISRTFRTAATKTQETPSLLLWANMLRVIPNDGISLADLPTAARISRRAVKAMLRLEKRGLLAVREGVRAGSIVRLTEVGRTTRDGWADVVVEVERQWSARVQGAKQLRGALEGIVGRIELELPHYPMPYGGSDGSAVGGPWIKAKDGPPRVPAHGTDWTPVLRGSSRGVGKLPLFALASQALMAFTIDYEEEALCPMAVGALIARTMRTSSTPLDRLPRFLGVNGSGKSGLERHGVVRVTRNGRRRLAKLTDVGVLVRNSHDHLVKSVTADWHERYGVEPVSALAKSLAGVDGQLDGRLPDYVLVQFSPGPGTSPTTGFHDVSFDANYPES